MRPPQVLSQDRKSTRLNSSHVEISYAVFCLKKKKNHRVRFDIRLNEHDHKAHRRDPLDPSRYYCSHVRRRERDCVRLGFCFLFFFFNDTATTEIYTLSLHDALPI